MAAPPAADTEKRFEIGNVVETNHGQNIREGLRFFFFYWLQNLMFIRDLYLKAMTLTVDTSPPITDITEKRFEFKFGDYRLDYKFL